MLFRSKLLKIRQYDAGEVWRVMRECPILIWPFSFLFWILRHLFRISRVLREYAPDLYVLNLRRPDEEVKKKILVRNHAPEKMEFSGKPRFTGEYFVPGASGERIEADHMERYRFASRYAGEKAVLDIACGTGYAAPLFIEAGAIDRKSVV